MALSALSLHVDRVRQRLKAASGSVQSSAALAKPLRGLHGTQVTSLRGQKSPAWCAAVPGIRGCNTGRCLHSMGWKRNTDPRGYLQQLGRDLGISHSLRDQC